MRQTALVRLILLIASISFFHHASATDLLQAYQQALANDPVYASARAQSNADQELSIQGRAGLLPSVNLSGAVMRNNRDDTPDYSTHSYTLALTQPLFDAAAWQNYEQSKLYVTASEATFSIAQQDLILRVAQAYFDVLTAQDTLASLQAQKTAINEQLASAKRNFEVGNATITDTHEAQARHDLVVAQELAAQNDVDIKQAALQQIIGSPPGVLAVLRADVRLSAPVPAQITNWVDRAEQQNFSVTRQQLALEIAKREITRNRAGHYPSVNLVASRSENTSQQRNSFSNQNSNTNNGPTNAIGVQWNIPLFSGFAVTSRTRQAISLEDKARADLENARRSAAQAARQAYLGVNSNLAEVKALEAAKISSQSALDSNLLGYEVGVRINIDVLNAQQQLYATERDLSAARYSALMNGLRLKSAAGILQEQDLRQINALLSAP